MKGTGEFMYSVGIIGCGGISQMHQRGLEDTGRAAVKGDQIKLRVAYPAPLRALVTRVVYRIYPAGGGEAELHIVDAAWFADTHPQQPANGSRQRSPHRCLPLTINRKPGAAPIGLIEAQVYLSSRQGITIPLHVGAAR